MPDVVNTLTLVNETARVRKLQPTIILAFIHINWWATSTFIIRNIPCCLFALGNNEGVVHNNGLCGAQIFSGMDTAIHLLKCLSRCERLFFTSTSILYGQSIALDDVEGISRVVMPLERLTRIDRECSYRHRCRTSKSCDCWMVPTASMTVTAAYAVTPMRRTAKLIAITRPLRVLNFILASSFLRLSFVRFRTEREVTRRGLERRRLSPNGREPQESWFFQLASPRSGRKTNETSDCRPLSRAADPVCYCPGAHASGFILAPAPQAKKQILHYRCYAHLSY